MLRQPTSYGSEIIDVHYEDDNTQSEWQTSFSFKLIWIIMLVSYLSGNPGFVAHG